MFNVQINHEQYNAQCILLILIIFLPRNYIFIYRYIHAGMYVLLKHESQRLSIAFSVRPYFANNDKFYIGNVIQR